MLRRVASRLAICWTIVVIGSLAIAAGIAIRAPQRAPIHRGDSHTFWFVAADVRLSPDAGGKFRGDAYIIDHWAAYDIPHLRGSELFRSPLSEVTADLNSVIVRLEQAVQEKPESPEAEGFLKWRERREDIQTVESLVSEIQNARMRDSIRRDADMAAYSLAQSQVFWTRWQRTQWQWAGYFFEWFYFSSLLLFIVWPFMYCRLPGRIAVRIGLFPLLVYAPLYLGYARDTFVARRPVGGVLYPELMIRLPGGFFTRLDGWLLSRVPPLLESLSSPIGLPVVVTRMRFAGPTCVLLFGLLTAALAFALSIGYRTWIRPRQASRLDPPAPPARE